MMFHLTTLSLTRFLKEDLERSSMIKEIIRLHDNISELIRGSKPWDASEMKADKIGLLSKDIGKEKAWIVLIRDHQLCYEKIFNTTKWMLNFKFDMSLADKVVLKLDVHDEKAKQEAMKTISSLTGIDSIVMDMNEKKLIVIESVDPVIVVSKLRTVVTIRQAKEPEKKKEEAKKEEGKKGDDKKNDEEKQIEELVKAYRAYNPYMTQYYHIHNAEENPNACVIC
ncbi:heavy metal-associated isoprenylated plant protein 39-like [Camellia sinensis]|uniref:heavy metal-associated isoprenylated plant protein 39-like n=1 Tax=Camellia sinensis TaxID=4442 RepID=UPI00103566D5|nr:heavy metal-associated isoprenylated plant protein 39-like [Camellia sinensis]